MSLRLDLDDLAVESVAALSAPAVSLESLTGGHGMAEMAASCIGSPLVICSCCCCCGGGN
ncbi:thiomuracin/GE37468 family thiazolyl RiPP peptide [Streptosporangium sp. NPDC051023]|uniref:thiomuracin/GE37468 family thiazolyl RiPP peptide n=1 Tax=Streptosporangium sp. NPDC051023 TaxID=3155410 RepID=UPI00344CFDEC